MGNLDRKISEKDDLELENFLSKIRNRETIPNDDDACFNCPRGGNCTGIGCAVINSARTSRVLNAQYMSRGSASRVK